MSLNPIPTMYTESLVEDMPSVLPNLIPLRKAPTKRIFSPDEINSLSYKNLEMKDYSQLNENTLHYLHEGYLCSTCEDHIVFYKMEKTTALIPVVTESIRIDAKLHVQLYCKGCPLPLSLWFREGRNCKLTSLTQLENFPSYNRATSELISHSISEELQHRRFIKKGHYSTALIRYALMLR